MTTFNEHALELSIMELFQQEGYTYTSGEEIHKEVSDVLLRDDMRLAYTCATDTKSKALRR